jgi:hypothetical protein
MFPFYGLFDCEFSTIRQDGRLLKVRNMNKTRHRAAGRANCIAAGGKDQVHERSQQPDTSVPFAGTLFLFRKSNAEV